MDSSDRAIIFDRYGVCDHCNNFTKNILPKWEGQKSNYEVLNQVSKKIKKAGKGKDFDCIIGMSGGIDSSYLTYIAKEVMGLRPLVFHVDAGWNSQIAVNNIERLIDGLNLDLFTEVIDWAEMRDLQVAFFKSGVPHIDTPQDHAFFATMYKFASKHKVKHILTGSNISTECVRNPIDWMYYQSDSKQLLDIHQKFGSLPLKSFPITSIVWHKIWLPYFRGIKVVKPLDMVPYIKEDAKKFLIDRFGWQPYPQKHFESRFTKFYESYWLPKRFGFDVRRVQYSSLILTGQMSRASAIKLLDQPSYDAESIEHEKEFVANKLGLSIKDIQLFMELPHKTFRDYKNQQMIYHYGRQAMQILGLDVGGKR